MLTLLRRRAGFQLPLMIAILVVVVIGATLLGVCTLLLTTSQERAFDEGVARAPARDVAVTAFATEVLGRDARPVTEDSRAVLAEALAPFPITSTARASSVMRALGPQTGTSHRWAYLSAVEGLSSQARLSAGRWPRAATGPAPGRPLEAVVLEPTLHVLGLTSTTALGHRVDLGEEIRPDLDGPQSVVIVGVFAPRPDSGWDRDPLSAAGYDPSYTDGRYPQPARVLGPFVVDPADLYASGSTINRMQVTAHPDLSAPTSATLNRIQAALGRVDNTLGRALGTRVKIERVDSGLPATLAAAHAQVAVTRATVLVVVLLGLVLAAAALGLAGRLVAALRTEETALFATFGAGRGQLAATAAAEALGLAGLATVIAVPLSGLVHSGLTHRPTLAAAGLAARPEVTPAQIAAVAAGAVLLAAVLVVPSLRPDPAQAGTSRGRLALLTRSGADLGLLALAATGWWQLRSQPGAGTGTDTVRVLAPALFLLAGAALALRLVAPPLRVAQWWARRSRALVLPLAVFEAARRPQAAAAALLVALAAAAGTFGVAFGAIWDTSQHDQAAVRVGTDLSLALTAPAVTGQGTTVAAATGGVVSPAMDRGVAVGQWLGGIGDPPRLLAVDASRAGDLLRGRLSDGRTWAQVGAGIGARDRVTGVPLRRDPGLVLTGTTPSPNPLQVVARLVVQDPDGLRTPCTVDPIALDGRPHPVRLCRPVVAGQSIVAIAMQISADPAAEVESDFSTDESGSPESGDVDLTLKVPAPAGARAARWFTTPTGEAPQEIGRLSAEVRAGVSAGGGASLVRTTARVRPELMGFQPAEFVATAFEPPRAVPVAVSARLFDVLRTPIGSTVSVTMGTSLVTVVVTSVVPSVPSAPQAVAMLADIDVLSRALIPDGNLAPPGNAWWVGSPRRSTAAAAAARLGLGEVVTRAEVDRQLTAGPLRVGLPAALTVLIPATLLLLLAGTVMHVTSDVEARALEVARLRGLGLSRRDIFTALLAQHGGLQILLLGAGTLVGALAARFIGPLLIRSELGAAPVPAALARWPWPAEGALLAVLLVGGTAVVALVVAVQVRRADAAHLRVGA